MSKTYMADNKTIERKWFVIDAEGEILGRLATEVASILRGKHKPSFTPHVDCGDYVIIVNAEKVALTGKKLKNKLYYRHSGYASGLKTRTAAEMLALQPQKVLEQAIKGMLPKNKLGDAMYRKLFVYAGPDHPHQAQKPEELKVRR
ncbi:MAG TPA: 50S ribosomal protein L13 [Acholeplasmataceae bacterium]|jgi:large subunit ribosomal protein L13|nr:50S ribosomal protein L13 [Acholeplasmataceae bacterium]